MSDEQTNQTTETTNTDAPQQEAATTMPGDSSTSADTFAALGASVGSSDALASVQSFAPAESIQQSSADLGNGSAASSSIVADAASPQSSVPVGAVSEDPNVNSQTSAHQWTPEQLAQIQAIGNPPAVGLGSASSAAAQPENGMQSSANTAQQNVATQGISASESRAKGALASLQRLREHLWTFEHSAVAHLHAEIDKLESIFR